MRKFESACLRVSCGLAEPGEVILDYAKRMLALNEEALLAASGVKVEGKVRLGLLQDFA
jgi:DNA-binding transcriptional LysR family regulator